MKHADPKRQFAVEVVRRLTDAGFQALWAGGCVRDLLLKRTAGDYDVATDARPEQVRDLFGHRRTLAVGASFGVIIVRGPRKAGQVEVATFRAEGPYSDGRRPDRVSFTSAEEDARRRDFTINGIFYDPLAEEVLDYVGGQDDLQRKIVRAIGEPHERMNEDKLRMLRAVRFAATLEFELDATTAAAIRDMAGDILVVSAERIAQELRKMLTDRHRRRAVELTRRVGLLTVIFPELSSLAPDTEDNSGTPEWQQTLQMLGSLTEPRFELAAAALFANLPPAEDDESAPEKSADRLAERVRAICRRLRLSNDETDCIAWLVAHRDTLTGAAGWTPAELKRLMSHAYIHDLLALFRVWTEARHDDPAPLVFCEEFLRTTPPAEINPRPLITGEHLIKKGLEPGPLFRDILEAIRDAQLNGQIHTKAEALQLADRLVQAQADN